MRSTPVQASAPMVAAVFVAGATLLLAACGGSSDGPGAASTLPAVSTAVTVDAGSTAAGSGGSPTGGTTGGSGGSGTTSGTVVTPGGTIDLTDPSATEPAGAAIPPGELLARLRSIGTSVEVDGELLQPLTFDLVVRRADGTVMNDDPRLRTILVIADADISVGCPQGCGGAAQPTDLATAVARAGALFHLTVLDTGPNARVTAVEQVAGG